MRRSVSIGVALVAGAMAWSDATGAAAPGPNSQQAAPTTVCRPLTSSL